MVAAFSKSEVVDLLCRRKANIDAEDNVSRPARPCMHICRVLYSHGTLVEFMLFYVCILLRYIVLSIYQ